LENPSVWIPYITSCWLTSIWDFIGKSKIKIKVTSARLVNNQLRTRLLHNGQDPTTRHLQQSPTFWHKCSPNAFEGNNLIWHSRCPREAHYWRHLQRGETNGPVLPVKVATTTNYYHKTVECMESSPLGSIHILWKNIATTPWQLDWPSDTNVVVFL
jgi:hypothetical protein